MNRLLLVVLMLLTLGLSLVQAQSDMSYEGVDPSGQTVVYWHQYSDDSSQAETMAALVEDFNSSNEYGITVETIHQGSYGPIEDLMNTAILSGELPNPRRRLRQRRRRLGKRRRRSRYQSAAQQSGMGHPAGRTGEPEL